MAILLALIAAAANAVAMILQRIGVESADEDPSGHKWLLARVLKKPVWFGGLAVMTAAFLFQVLALAYGNLSTVQPVMVTELVFLLVILAVWFDQKLGWREWLGACGTALGLGVFLSVGSEASGRNQPGSWLWILALVATGGAVILATAVAQRGSRSWRAAWFGLAGGLCFAFTAACIKASTDEFSDGVLHVFLHWQSYGIAGGGLAGLVLTQHALQAGPVAASQSALLIANPMASIAIGVLLFGDHIRSGRARVSVEVVSLGVMFAGLFVLSHSPLIAASQDEERLSVMRQAARLGPDRLQ